MKKHVWLGVLSIVVGIPHFGVKMSVADAEHVTGIAAARVCFPGDLLIHIGVGQFDPGGEGQFVTGVESGAVGSLDVIIAAIELRRQPQPAFDTAQGAAVAAARSIVAVAAGTDT